MNAPIHPVQFSGPRKTGRHPLCFWAHSQNWVGHPGTLCGQSPGQALRDAVESSGSDLEGSQN